jgi:hypothetical protein
MADSFDFRSDAIWDELVSGIAPDLEGDTTAADAVRFVHPLSQTPLPGSARERARQRVFDSMSSVQENDMTALTIPVAAPATNGHKPIVYKPPAHAAPGRSVSRRQRWLSAAAAIVLILAGLGGWLTYDRVRQEPTVPAVIPAIQATPTGDWPLLR